MQIWYSLRLTDEDFQLVFCKLQELIEASSLEELTGGAMKMNQRQFQRIAEVWRTWLQLSSRQGDWITEARRRQFENPTARIGKDLYLEEIPGEHRESASDWFENGILSSKKARKRLPRENFTLTGSDFQIGGNKGDFTYIIQSSVLPFLGWDYKDVRQWDNSSSILKMYNEYVSHVLEKCSLKLATGKIKFDFLLCNCMEIAPLLPRGQTFDRVTTSNIADYVTLARILDTFEPLLSPKNPSSVIITEFQSWLRFTDLREKAMAHSFFLPQGDNFRSKVLEDTKNPAISSSIAYQGFVDYRDHSAEFIKFLRASLLISEVPDERNRRRTWKSVADHNGLIARNFLRCQNRVFPARWMLNCRRVTMLAGFEKAVEWIVKPK